MSRNRTLTWYLAGVRGRAWPGPDRPPACSRTAAAIRLVSDGIQGAARYAGAPQKYNATVSRA